MSTERYVGEGVELRLGDYRSVLADVGEVDAVICDPPYSERTHAGALDATTHERGVNGYASWDADDASEFVRSWAPRCRSWMVIHTDDVIGPAFLDAMGGTGRYVFPLVPVLQQQPRTTGDGHPQHGHYLAVSRPRERRFLSWGSLPGWYEARRDGSIVRGGKPLDLMRAIVVDHSRPGDLVCDPTCGGGTTLLATMFEGRRCVGAELDPTTYAKAVDRLRGWGPTEVKGQRNLFLGGAA